MAMNQRMQEELRTSAKAGYRAIRGGGLNVRTIKHFAAGARNYATGRVVVQGVSVKLPSSMVAKRYAVVAAGAAGVGTVAYGFSNRVGRKSSHRSVRVYRKVAHASARTVAVPGQFAWGTAKGYLNTGSVITGVRRGASRAMTSAEGTNSGSGRRNTLHAKQRRDVIKKNRAAAQRAATKKATGGGGGRKFWARDSRGRFR